MGILPLQFKDGENARTLNLDGSEIISITGFADDLQPGQTATMQIVRANGETDTTKLLIRIDSLGRSRILQARWDSGLCDSKFLCLISD